MRFFDSVYQALWNSRWSVGSLAGFIVFGALGASGQSAPHPLEIHVAPERPIIEEDRESRYLNFDIEVTNTGAATLRLGQIELRLYDSAKRLVMQKALNRNAFAPSMEVIGQQTLSPGMEIDIFNPFYRFATSTPLNELRFSFCVQLESTAQEEQANRHRLPGDCDLRQTISVTPRAYKDRTVLALPLRDTVFVWEGHDFYSHHLRVPLGNAAIRKLGITANSNQFADDFIYVDSQGKAYHDDPRKLEDWYDYDKPIYAPGDGRVIATTNDIPDNWFNDGAATSIGHPGLPADKDPKGMGNFVLIDHQDGEWSLLLHMRPGSLAVQKGQQVKRGQLIGKIGFSGDAIFPHLHYTLMDGPTPYQSWGLPSYFIGTEAIPSDLLGHTPRSTSTLESGAFIGSKHGSNQQTLHSSSKGKTNP